jgi:hypothetical protein
MLMERRLESFLFLFFRFIKMKWNKWLPFIGILFFGLIIAKIGLKKILTSVANSNYVYLLIALLFFIPMILFQVWKWDYLLRKQNIRLGFFYLLRLQMISLFYGAVTPGRLGSFVKIPYLCRKTKKPASECSSNVIIDRLFDFVVVALFAATGAVLLLRSFVGFFYFSLIVFIGLLFSMMLFTNKKTSQFILKIVFRFLIPEKWKNKARISFSKFYATLPSMLKLIPAFIITIATWFVIYSQEYCVALAFSIKVPYFYFITTIAVVNLVGLIPITVSGIGTREAALLTLFSIYSLAPENIVGYSITQGIMSLIVYLIFGLVAISKTKE